MRGSLSCCLIFGALSFSACAGEPDRPPAAPPCDPNVADCTPPPPLSGAGGSAAVDGGAGTGGGADVTGQVGIYNDDRFTPSVGALYGRAATVEAEGSGARVSASWNGSTPFVLQAVARKTENWFSVEPTLTTDDAMLTLHPVDATVASDVDLFLVRPSVLDQIFSILTIPVDRLLTRGHAVVFIKDAVSAEPVAGVRVTAPGAEVVAYAVNGAWSDVDVDSTGPLGLVVVGNVDAAEFPVGSPRTLSLSGAVVGSAELRIARNAVTVADIFVTR